MYHVNLNFTQGDLRTVNAHGSSGCLNKHISNVNMHFFFYILCSSLYIIRKVCYIIDICILDLTFVVSVVTKLQ
jgi:hypothetical protein